MMYTIINSRVNARKPMIINTNLTPTEMKARYGDRIASRLSSSSQILPFYGEDIRMKMKIENS